MPFAFPTLPQLRQQSRAYFTARLPGADSRVRRNSIQVAADMVAGALWLMYFYLAWLAKQLFTDTAETTYLERDGRTYGITRGGAAAAAGPVVFYGIAGTPIPAGTQVGAEDGTVQYLTQADADIDSTGEVSVAVVASTGGTLGNFVAGTPLTLQTAIAGVLPGAVVDTAGLEGGTDAETDAQLRARILARKQNPPQGGAAADYVAWAKLVPGVTRAWVYPLRRGGGTVDVCFVMDNRTSIIPLAADVAAVQASIDANRPVTASALAFAPGTLSVPVQLSHLDVDSAATIAAINVQLAALFATATPGGATFGDGVSDILVGGTVFVTAIAAAISAAAGVSSYDLVLPVGDVTTANGVLPVLGAVTVP